MSNLRWFTLFFIFSHIFSFQAKNLDWGAMGKKSVFWTDFRWTRDIRAVLLPKRTLELLHQRWGSGSNHIEPQTRNHKRPGSVQVRCQSNKIKVVRILLTHVIHFPLWFSICLPVGYWSGQSAIRCTAWYRPRACSPTGTTEKRWSDLWARRSTWIRRWCWASCPTRPTSCSN